MEYDEKKRSKLPPPPSDSGDEPGNSNNRKSTRWKSDTEKLEEFKAMVDIPLDDMTIEEYKLLKKTVRANLLFWCDFDKIITTLKTAVVNTESTLEKYRNGPLCEDANDNICKSYERTINNHRKEIEKLLKINSIIESIIMNVLDVSDGHKLRILRQYGSNVSILFLCGKLYMSKASYHRWKTGVVFKIMKYLVENDIQIDAYRPSYMTLSAYTFDQLKKMELQ